MNNATSPRLERDILQDAATALAEHDQLHSTARALDARIAALCREYGDVKRLYAFAPHHLRKICAAHGLLS
jgi:predicted nucleic acid-binding protein